jgi:dockerin type I repeat protein
VYGGALYVEEVAAVQLSRSTFTNPTVVSPNALMRLVNTQTTLEASTVNDSSGTWAVVNHAFSTGRSSYLLMKGSTVNGSDPTGILAATSLGALASDSRIEYAGTIVSGHAKSFDLTAGTGVSLGYNLSSDSTGNLTATGDLPSTNPLLGPLGYHGGQTPVFDLKPASPAKDAIPAADCGPALDQRGFTRPFGSACDIGAVERVIGGDVNGDGAVNVTDVFSLINFLFANGTPPAGEPDVNGDGDVNVSDVFYLINRLFAGGPAPV